MKKFLLLSVIFLSSCARFSVSDVDRIKVMENQFPNCRISVDKQNGHTRYYAIDTVDCNKPLKSVTFYMNSTKIEDIQFF